MNSNSWKLIHDQLLALNESHGGVAKFCERSGLPRQTVEYWLKHGTIPNLDKIDQIAAGLDVAPRELFTGPDLPPAWREIFREIGDIDKSEMPAVLTGIRAVLAALRKQPARLRNRND